MSTFASEETKRDSSTRKTKENLYKIEFATEKDYQKITELFYRTDYENFPPPLSKRWIVTAGVRDEFDNDISDEERLRALQYRTEFLGKKGRWLVAKDDSKVIGTVIIIIPEREVEALIVDPNYRRQGIATSLLDKSLEHLFDIDRYPIRTTTWSGNEASRSLFEKLGFRESDRKYETRGGDLRESIIFELTKLDYLLKRIDIPKLG